MAPHSNSQPPAPASPNITPPPSAAYTPAAVVSHLASLPAHPATQQEAPRYSDTPTPTPITPPRTLKHPSSGSEEKGHYKPDSALHTATLGHQSSTEPSPPRAPAHATPETVPAATPTPGTVSAQPGVAFAMPVRATPNTTVPWAPMWGAWGAPTFTAPPVNVHISLPGPLAAPYNGPRSSYGSANDEAAPPRVFARSVISRVREGARSGSAPDIASLPPAPPLPAHTEELASPPRRTSPQQPESEPVRRKSSMKKLLSSPRRRTIDMEEAQRKEEIENARQKYLALHLDQLSPEERAQAFRRTSLADNESRRRLEKAPPSPYRVASPVTLPTQTYPTLVKPDWGEEPPGAPPAEPIPASPATSNSEVVLRAALAKALENNIDLLQSAEAAARESLITSARLKWDHIMQAALFSMRSLKEKIEKVREVTPAAPLPASPSPTPPLTPQPYLMPYPYPYMYPVQAPPPLHALHSPMPSATTAASPTPGLPTTAVSPAKALESPPTTDEVTPPRRRRTIVRRRGTKSYSKGRQEEDSGSEDSSVTSRHDSIMYSMLKELNEQRQSMQEQQALLLERNLAMQREMAETRAAQEQRRAEAAVAEREAERQRVDVLLEALLNEPRWAVRASTGTIPMEPNDDAMSLNSYQSSQSDARPRILSVVDASAGTEKRDSHVATNTKPPPVLHDTGVWTEKEFAHSSVGPDTPSHRSPDPTPLLQESPDYSIELNNVAQANMSRISSFLAHERIQRHRRILNELEHMNNELQAKQRSRMPLNTPGPRKGKHASREVEVGRANSTPGPRPKVVRLTRPDQGLHIHRRRGSSDYIPC